MTPSDRIVKAVHMAIEQERAMLDQIRVDGTHHVRITVKPRGDGWRVSVDVATFEVRV